MITSDNKTFTFDIATETANGILAESRLELEIRNNLNIFIGLSGTTSSGTTFDLEFKAVLSAPEILELVSLVLAHLGNPIPNDETTTFNPKHVIGNKLLVATQFEPHNADHASGGVDEINVTGLVGVLVNQQHVIPSEAVSAMGAKANSNSLNHDRFQQSEIVNLPESSLGLNFQTHDNSNDLSTAQKQAIDTAVNPSSTNPFITASEQIPGLQGNDGLQGPQGIQGLQGPQGIQGNTGPQGEAFTIFKTYISITTMNSDLPNVAFGKFVMIDTGSINDVDTGKLYFRDTGSWAYISDLSGATGIQGPQGVSGTNGIQGNTGPQGVQGNTGPQGVQGNTGPQGIQGPQKRTITVNIMRYGSVSDDKLRLSGDEIDSFESSYTPPFDCKVREMVLTSKNTIEDSSQVGKVEAFYKPLTTFDDITTSDAIEWSAQSDGLNVMYNAFDSQFWGYDLTSENQVMLRSRRYGFYHARVGGSDIWKNISIQLILEEI